MPPASLFVFKAYPMTKRPKHIIGGHDLDSVASYIESNDIRKVLVLLGAGCSVAAGIPDFRTPGTGIYYNLDKYNLSDPTDAFSLDLLRENPSIFYNIAKEMDLWPGKFKPTKVHHFVKLLHDEGRLLCCCTQNIDGLETEAGLPMEKLVEAHGSFRTASCIECRERYDIDRNRKEAQEGVISHCEACGGIVKPDVVFFGEQLPEKFFKVVMEDTKEAELLLIIGTSLNVHPFAEIPFHVGPHIPRIVLNMERVGGRMFHFPDDPPYPYPSDDGEEREETASSSSSDGFSPHLHMGGQPDILRDLLFRQDCQFSVEMLAQAMGLGERLSRKVEEFEGHC
ncbi:silent information regulator 2 [Angomonas deanei]|nr:silent information regulator 2 [Angomonas deanei]|eukprot:EPY43228.1 silent information regulator 2 [Angomonas deanei]